MRNLQDNIIRVNTNHGAVTKQPINHTYSAYTKKKGAIT